MNLLSMSRSSCTSGSSRPRCCSFVLCASILLAGLTAGPAALGQINAPIVGTIEIMQIDNPTDPYSGGRIVVGGQIVIIPRNLVLEMPANFLPMGAFFAQAPPDCVIKGQSGVAVDDDCEGASSAAVATIMANRTAAGDLIAGDVFIEKGQETVTGVVTFINYNEGYFRLNGVVGSDTTGLLIRLNDPDGRHTIQSGTGCRLGASNCSADVRFTNDPDNYTFTYSTGYPACIPSTVVDGINRLTAADATGVGDPFCPQTNRDVIFPVPDSTRFAPLRIGDAITADGNFETINRVLFLSAHSITVGVAVKTSTTDPTQPDYVILEELFIDAGGFQNQRARALFIGFVTAAGDVFLGQPGAQVDIFGLHVDAETNTNHEVPLASTVGNPLTVNQGIGVGATGIFKIRYDVDFILGAPVIPGNSPCTHLRNAGFTNACSIFQTIEEEFNVLSPMVKEVIARTRRKTNSPNLQVFDILGRSTRWGEYLSPIVAEFPEFVEINLALVAQPFIFAGVPWNLDRRLHPAGCITGICDTTPQPLDPFPYSRLDPRTQAGIPGVPFGSRDRIISRWGPDPITGIPGPANVLMNWPPPDPPPLATTLGALKLKITRATHKVGPNATSIDVWATAQPGHNLELSGPGVITTPMESNGAGSFFAHTEIPNTVPLPASITVTDLTDLFAAQHLLIDEVSIATATYLFGTPTLSIFASTSAFPGTPLTLCTGEPLGPNGQLDLLVGQVPPENVCVESPTFGGRLILPVTVSGCDDNNMCTADAIDPVLGCTHTPIVCDDGIPCTVDSCNPALGCQAAANDALCGNGLFCDGAEVCDPLLGCQPGTPVDCADAFACTTDSCNETLDQCDHLPDNLLCPDAVACTVDVCDSLTGCQHLPDDAACSNGIFCDGAETCDVIAGCGPGAAPCNDFIACTTDTCDELTASCANTPVDSICDDGMLCNGTETCDPFAGCQPGTPIPGCCVADVDCDNGNACDGLETCDLVLNQCVPGTPVVCNDGLFCNGTEVCVNGACPPGIPPCPDVCQQCNEAGAVCDWCVVDINQNGTIDGVDFGFFAGCFGACYPPGDPCLDANFDGDPAGCVGGGDFAAITGCFGLTCASCPTCFPAPPVALAGAVAGIDGGTPTTVVLQLVARTRPSQQNISAVLPRSKREFSNRENVVIEVWARTRNPAEALSSVYADVNFDPTKLIVKKVIPGSALELFHRHVTDNHRGVVRAVGGCTALGKTDVGANAQWIRVSTLQMQVAAPGVTRLRIGPSARPLGISIVEQPGDLEGSGLLFDGVELVLRGKGTGRRQNTALIQGR